MSINNDGRGSMVSVSGSSYLTTGTVYTRSVKGVEEKHQAKRQAGSTFDQVSAKQNKASGEFFRSNSAQEIHQSISDGYQELSFLTQQRAHPFAYVNSANDADSDYSQRDFKRHQNYFNQIMNYENPAGSWIDVQG
ncbi:MAG: hypothetical protein JJ895_08005 [Balneolaceae bacterium]|nr:hypothetical protein [Balneolaceae bacterium]